MADVGNQSKVARADRVPGDLDNFFKWAQGTNLVEEPVKETLRLIEKEHRQDFELIFKGMDTQESKMALEASIDGHKAKLKAIEAFEKTVDKAFDAFRQTCPEVEKYGIAIDGAQCKTNMLDDLRDFHEEELEDCQYELDRLTSDGHPPSRETAILKEVFGIIFFMDDDTQDPPRIPPNPNHARDITKLIIFHETGQRHEGKGGGRSGIDVAYGRLLKRYGVLG